jgi:hypothetical protein
MVSGASPASHVSPAKASLDAPDVAVGTTEVPLVGDGSDWLLPIEG